MDYYKKYIKYKVKYLQLKQKYFKKQTEHVKERKNILLTLPHTKCKPGDKFICDYTSEYWGNILYNILKDTYNVRWLQCNSYRDKGHDCNRKEIISQNAEFNEELIKDIKWADIVIDVHSQSQNEPYFLSLSPTEIDNINKQGSNVNYILILTKANKKKGFIVEFNDNYNNHDAFIAKIKSKINEYLN